MNNQFHNITLAEMTFFLEPKGFTQIEVEQTYEIVFAKRVDVKGHQLSLRVFTGIDAGTDESRECGADAVRVMLFTRTEQGTILRVCGCGRVNRIKTWKKNLGKRLRDFAMLFPGHTCPSCSAIMRRVEGKFGTFWGCTNYPKCRHTLNEE